MTRAAIYARYSSDLQREASIEDQVRACRSRLKAEGWQLANVYTDHGMSGASSLRPGYQQLLQDARAGAFEIVVAEGLDRLSRDQEDVAALYKHLSFANVRLITLAEGEISELHVGLKGTMNALYLKDLAQKTRRGLEGRVRQGRSGGGLCYGYDVIADAGDKGRRTINDDEAVVVRRIFREYASGLSPRTIARALNAEGIPGPRSGTWGASTIYGNWRRGTGILNNDLYVGRLIWNRQRFVKDPRTGRRQARANPKDEWIVEAVPELRIIDDELWQAVKARQSGNRERMQAGKLNPLNAARRNRYLLSGLLTCGACGGGYAIMAKDRYGCSRHRNKGTCDNSLTIGRQEIEGRVLTGLRERLLAPDLVADFVRLFHEEVNRQSAEADRQWSSSRRELTEVGRKIAAILSAIEDGVYTATTRDRLLALEARKAELEAQLPPEPAPRLHPRLAEVYRAKVERLEEALNRADTRTEATQAMRGLIEAIRLTPDPATGRLHIELFGELGAILRLCEHNDRRPAAGAAGRQVSMVAGARNQRYQQGLFQAAA